MNWQSAVQITKGESTKRRRRLRGQGSQAASSGQAGHSPLLGGASLPRPTGTFVGRASELAQLERSLTDVPVAVICGVPGVGKSTLALAQGATWSGPAVYLKLTPGTSIAHIAEAIFRRLGVARNDLSVDDAERLDELWSLIDGVSALLVLDDLHCLDAASRGLVVDSATRRLHNGRLIAASRELVPSAPGAPDRLQLRLEGLRRDDAAQLWNRLKDLYGAGSDFEVAWRRSLGNPYLLRQGHVATLTGDHPMLAIARGLEPEQRRSAAAVALSYVPLPRSVLLRIPGTAAATLEQLVTRLIIDATADAEYAMHDLMREAILEDIDRTTLDEVRAELVDALPGGELDAVTVMQESTRHLRVLGRHADVAALLVRTSAGLIRQGATTALLHELDAVPVEARGPELQLLRARTLTRSILQTRRAYEELQPLATRAGTSAVTRYFFATAATMHGQLDEAEPVLRALQSAADATPELRAEADYGLAWVAVYRGQIAETIELAELRERTAEPRGRVHWMTLRMFALAASGADQAAADLASRLTELVETELVDHRSQLFTPGLCCVMLARAGRLEEAEHARRLAERGVRRPEDSAELGWIGMLIRGERGERGTALEYYRGVQRIMDRSGYLVGMIWTRSFLGRLLLLHGWRREGLSMLAEGLAQCRAKQAFGLMRIIEQSFDDDPLSDGWLGRDDVVPSAKLGDVIRSQVRTVLRLACTGDRPLGAEHIGAAIPATPDYAFDRALLELASAVLASRQGRRRLAMSHLQHAISEAAGCAADPDLIPAMYERLRVGVVVGTQAATTRPAPLQIDCVRHEVLDAGVRVVLTSRVVLRRLLYAFIVAPERYLDRTAIARVLWNTEYAPLRHDSSIKSNIWRLREIVEGTRVVIQTEKDGYRLSVPADTAIVPPE